MLQEFKKFALRGNMLDMAVGIIIGASFGKIVSSLVNDILLPPVGLLLGKVDFSNLFISLSGTSYATLAEAKAKGAATINYGLFLNSILDFLLVAAAVFLLVRQVNRMLPEPKAEPATQTCPYCLSAVAKGASRCPHCTSALAAPEN